MSTLGVAKCVVMAPLAITRLVLAVVVLLAACAVMVPLGPKELHVPVLPLRRKVIRFVSRATARTLLFLAGFM